MITRILLFIISSALIISFYAYDDSETGFEWIYNYGDRTVAIIYFVLLFFIILEDSILNVVTDIVSVKESALIFSIWLYLIFVAGTFAFWLDGVFIGAMQHIIMRNIMIIWVLRGKTLPPHYL